MEEIRLIRPGMAYAEQIEAFRREVAAAGDADAFAGCCQLERCGTTSIIPSWRCGAGIHWYWIEL